MSSDKRCSECKRELPADNEHFPYTSKAGKRYLRAICKQCHALKSHAHYQANKKEIKKHHVVYNRRYRAEHRDAYNFKNRQYRQRKLWEDNE